MRCPRCQFEGTLVNGGCTRCGYVSRLGTPTNALPVLTQKARTSGLLESRAPVLLRSDMLQQGRYHLVEHIALPRNQREQGRAWLAADVQQSGSRVVIREIVVPDSLSPAQEDLFLRDVASRIVQLAQYDGFPRVLDMFSERGSHYIVLEQNKGKSLAQLITEQGVLPERTVAEYGRQICKMLNILEAQQPSCVHGAITPETIFISPDGKQASLVHIPLRPLPQVSTETSNGSNKMASSGYQAPEQVRGVTEPATDIYGLAGTLFHALTGYDPDKHMSFFFPPARRLNPAISSRMEAILSHALRLSLSQRYAHASNMQRDLDVVLTTFPVTDNIRRVNGHRPVDVSGWQERRRRRDRVSLASFVIVAVLVCVLLLGGILLAIARGPGKSVNASASATSTVFAGQTATAQHNAQVQAVMQQELVFEAKNYARTLAGISDGRFIFDTYTGRYDVSLKEQAASAQQHGDIAAAANLFSQAVSVDPADGEARIYSQDMSIAQSGMPYVTIVLGLGIDGKLADLASERGELQAAFEAQYEINEFALLPRGLQLRLLIASSGANAANVTTLAQFISNRVIQAQNPDHIIAVVGWPSSAETLLARNSITAAQIPLISPTASDLALNQSGSYFFRVSPPYDAQANALATVAVQRLRASTILVVHDPHNADSSTLASQFTVQASALKANIVAHSQDAIIEGLTSANGYQAIIKDAIASKASLIFLSGTDVDAVRLAYAIGQAADTDPTNTILAHLAILGGPALDSPLLLGQGNSPDALLAQFNAPDMQIIHSVAFADVHELALVKTAPAQAPTFFGDWAGLFQNSTNPLLDAPSANQYAILTYDAVKVVGAAAHSIPGTLTGQAVQQLLHSFGSGNVPAYQGVSGRIIFDPQGNPVNKALCELDVVNNGAGNVIKVMQLLGVYD